MSPETKALMREAIESVPAGSLYYRENRARLAVLFAMASTDFLVEK